MNRVAVFAKRAKASIAFPILEIACLLTAFVAALSGPFQTSALPVTARALFWLILMAWSALKWRLWFVFAVRDRARVMRMTAIGAVLLNLALPLEVELALAAVGIDAQIVHAEVVLKALAISAAIFAVIYGLSSRFAGTQSKAAPVIRGPLARQGIEPTRVSAVRAEDHYCRVWLREGGSHLILARFGDLLGELAGAEGLQVHRGAWLADASVTSVRRDARTWKVDCLGESFTISSRHVAAARQRGWLSRRR